MIHRPQHGGFARRMNEILHSEKKILVVAQLPRNLESENRGWPNRCRMFPAVTGVRELGVIRRSGGSDLPTVIMLALKGPSFIDAD